MHPDFLVLLQERHEVVAVGYKDLVLGPLVSLAQVHARGPIDLLFEHVEHQVVHVVLLLEQGKLFFELGACLFGRSKLCLKLPVGLAGVTKAHHEIIVFTYHLAWSLGCVPVFDEMCAFGVISFLARPFVFLGLCSLLSVVFILGLLPLFRSLDGFSFEEGLLDHSHLYCLF